MNNAVPTIAICNESSLHDQIVKEAAEAIQVQVTRDFAPHWGAATVMFVPKGKPVLKSAWKVVITDTLGTIKESPSSLPTSYLDLAANGTLSWTVSLSHAVLEMIANPHRQNAVYLSESAQAGTLYAVEVCDPICDDAYGYDINGVRVSNFVTPAWFERHHTGTTGFDHGGSLRGPLTLGFGGVVAAIVVGTGREGGWQAMTAHGTPKRLPRVL